MMILVKLFLGAMIAYALVVIAVVIRAILDEKNFK
jgi:hypothetical protein